ncbi:MAG: tetratricopeptide repeat protein [Anaerolineae bacterium]
MNMSRPLLLSLLRGVLLTLALLSVAAAQPERAGLSELRTAERYHLAGAHSAAEAHYLQAREALPDESLLRLAALYNAWGYPQKGLEALEEAASQRGPLPDEIQPLRLELLAKAGDWETLAVAAQAYLESDPTFQTAWAYLAQAQLRLQRCEAAQATAQRWYHNMPEDEAARRVWGVLALADAPSEAHTVLCKADKTLCARLAACADPAACDVEAGLAALRWDRAGLAACALARAVEANPTSGKAQAWLGATLEKIDRATEALAHLNRATALNPTSPLGWALLGRYQLERGNYAAAREALLTAHHLDPQNPALCLEMAAALAGESRYEALKPWIEAALERANEDPAIYKAAARFYLTRNLTHPPYPLEAAQDATTLAPEDAEAQMLLGWSLLQAGEPQAALEKLNRAVMLDPRLAQAHHLRGLALQALGRTEEAEAAFVQAIDLGYRG